MAPLGYDTKDRKITVNEAEAERVRTIFRGYLKLGSLNLLMADLRKRRIATKVRTLKSGQKVGGIPFTRGPLAHLLRNRFYIGEVAFKGEILKGEQIAIVDRELFDAVQARLDAQINRRKTARTNSEALLAGRIFDDRGNRMTPSHVRKRGIKYRYYLSSVLLQGQSDRAGSISRVPAAEIEAVIVRSVRERLKLSASVDGRRIIDTYIARVDIRPGKLVIKVVQAQRRKGRAPGDLTLHIPWHKPPSKRRREILIPDAIEPQNARPIRSETRATLVAAIARGRRWLKELVDDTRVTVESIAKREKCSSRQVNMTISLAFLAPNLGEGRCRRPVVAGHWGHSTS
jgi:site-specific DNA recombinase